MNDSADINAMLRDQQAASLRVVPVESALFPRRTDADRISALDSMKAHIDMENGWITHRSQKDVEDDFAFDPLYGKESGWWAMHKGQSFGPYSTLREAQDAWMRAVGL